MPCHLSKTLVLAVCALLLVQQAPWAAGNSSERSLFELSLEELMNIEVTSVEKRPQSRRDAAAALYVITSEDIRRSGATHLADVLRMAPGVLVSRTDSGNWAVSVRGFQQSFSSTLLVLIDGRTVYNPLFAGVYWDVQDLPLDNIERIEIIRGPGATVWGANAVNGVINIITKAAGDTTGAYLSATTGNQEQHLLELRYGEKRGNWAYRVYAKEREMDANWTAQLPDAVDDGRLFLGGFRADYQPNPEDFLTLQGAVYQGSFAHLWAKASFTSPYNSIGVNDEDVQGGHLLGRWTRSLGPEASLSLQAYYDRTDRDLSLSLGESRDTLDLEFRHSFRPAARHLVTWGLGFRYTGDHINNHPFLQFTPDHEQDLLWSLFIQDNITLAHDKLQLIAGSKFEHNEYSGYEVQPTIRLLWTPTEAFQAWTAVSRAVKTPSRFDQDSALTLFMVPPGALYPGSPLGQAVSYGTKDAGPESLTAYEAGLRFQAAENLSFDFSAYYNVYMGIRTAERGRALQRYSPLPHVIYPQRRTAPPFDATYYGYEVAAEWWVVPGWRLSAAYGHLRVRGDAGEALREDFPEHQVSLRSMLNLTKKVDFDTALYYLSEEKSGGHIPGHLRFDARLAWRPRDGLEVSLVGQNLFEPHHPEYWGPGLTTLTEIKRSIFAKITWRF